MYACGGDLKQVHIARQLAFTATGIIILALIVAGAFWQQTAGLVKEYDAILKLIGLGIGPFLAVLGFVWGRVDKAEIKALSEELGGEREKAEGAQKWAQDEKASALEAKREVEEKVQRIQMLETNLAKIADYGRLWTIKKNAPFADYRAWKYDPLGAKIVTIGLFKGGVGKSHLAANFAAYVSEKKQKPVLLIDLDYQGSLSTVVLGAAGLESPGSNVDALLAEDAGLATLSHNRVHLAKHGLGVALNKGRGLSKAWLVPAEYTLAGVEKLVAD